MMLAFEIYLVRFFNEMCENGTLLAFRRDRRGKENVKAIKLLRLALPLTVNTNAGCGNRP